MTQQPSSRIRRAPQSPATRGPLVQALIRWSGAMPALLAIACILLFGVLALGQRTAMTRASYEREAEASLSARDFKTARVCYERLLQWNKDDVALRFGLARALDGLGQTGEARQLLERLAPPDLDGYLPAHLFLAERLLDAPQHDAQSLSLAEKHLLRVLNADPSNAPARALLSSLYANTGRR